MYPAEEFHLADCALFLLEALRNDAILRLSASDMDARVELGCMLLNVESIVESMRSDTVRTLENIDLKRRLDEAQQTIHTLRSDNYWLRAEGTEKYDWEFDSMGWGFSQN